ncbi:MAG TPA: MBL fold metallo-hydrolase [Candidatus Limnocylindrales bacterium]|nr:MBL fold metallo-hydrolase [Candidatus Limnocylindrales bacterium]
MEIHFLGGATTVTGSQFLLVTDRARVLVDCGLFQGSPNEAVRNRVPFAFDPADLDAILLTHAHLDHCGLIPRAVLEGFDGPIYATDGTCELAELVLLDSGHLQEEFAKREARWEKRNPDKAVEDDREEWAAYEAALHLAENPGAADAARTDRPPAPDAATITSASASEEAAEATASGARRSETAGPGADDAEADLRGQPPSIDIDLDEPLYTERDARRAVELFRGVRYDAEIEVAPGIHATFVDAGHILGSAIIRVRASDADGEERTIVFSGDLGRPGTPIIRDPTILREADYVLIESTYGGREHEPHDEAIRILAETVRLVAEAEGVLLVPSFAIGRTQEVVWELDRLIEKGEIPQIPLFLDSPMASKASAIYRRHAEYFDEETGRLLREGDSPLDYPDQTETRKVAQSREIARTPRPYMIVASNGMLTGGRVLGHLKELVGDPKATLLFVGYQGQGTLGAHLQAGAREIRLDGRQYTVRCRVRSISGFSAHADESELLGWLANFADGKEPGARGFPRRVFLVHGDPEAQVVLEPKVRALGFDPHVPHWRERVALD